MIPTNSLSIYMHGVNKKVFFPLFWQNYGANCLTPIYSGVTNAADKQAVLDAHNNLRRKIAKGQETRGNTGPQPTAANMRKLVSKILLDLHIR
jgi:hypothetical protein